MELTLYQFRSLSRLIYDKLGLFFDDSKIYFLKKRVEKRLEKLGLDTADQYIFRLRLGDPDGAEMQALANLITTNETYMFREYEQLEAFANFCLPEVLSAKQEREEKVLRIWSAGCSSGEEAYTIAIIVREVFPQVHGWAFEVVGTDIDENVLAEAGRACYNERSMKEVPAEYLARHFTREGDLLRLQPRTASVVSLVHQNLHDHLAMRTMKGFDFIFCRNVLIYFDDDSRKGVVDHFYNALNPGGYLFLGHSESVGRITAAFRLRRMGNHLVYRKG